MAEPGGSPPDFLACEGCLRHGDRGAWHRIGLASHPWHPQGTIHFKEETIALCHPEPRFVILSAAQDLGPARDPALRSG